MSVTESQHSNVAKLLKKWSEDNHTCPICKSTRWNCREIYMLSEMPKEGYRNSESIIPILPCTCRNCGYIVLFNAIQLEIIDTKGKRL